MPRASKKRKVAHGHHIQQDEEQSTAAPGTIPLNDATALMPDISGILQTVNGLRAQFEQLKNAQIDYGDAGDEESLYDQFELEGLSKEEVKAYNATAPAGQKLEDVIGDEEEEEPTHEEHFNPPTKSADTLRRQQSDANSAIDHFLSDHPTSKPLSTSSVQKKKKKVAPPKKTKKMADAPKETKDILAQKQDKENIHFETDATTDALEEPTFKEEQDFW